MRVIISVMLSEGAHASHRQLPQHKFRLHFDPYNQTEVSSTRPRPLARWPIAGDSLLLEPNLPRIVRQDFSLPRWPERMNGFTIALLSDFHYDPYFSIHPLHCGHRHGQRSSS